MAGKRKLRDDDDGRVIASMNVDGMPWYQRSERFDKHRREQASDFSDLTKEEEREIIKGAFHRYTTHSSHGIRIPAQPYQRQFRR